MNPGIRAAIDQAFGFLPQAMDTPKARVMVYAIGFQESEFEFRRQMGNGPAMGFWQFERGGGVVGVMTHSASKGFMHSICAERGVAFDKMAIWQAIQFDDMLAAVAARLLLYTDPRPLPSEYASIDPADPEASQSWQYYERNWRPGKPHSKKWPASMAKALREMGLE